MSGLEFTEFFQNLWYDLMNPGQANILLLVLKVLFVLAAFRFAWKLSGTIIKDFYNMFDSFFREVFYFLFTPFRAIKAVIRKRRRKKENKLYNQRRKQEQKEQKERQELAEAERQQQKERDILLIKEHLEIKSDE